VESFKKNYTRDHCTKSILRQDKTKIVSKAQFTGVGKHFETNFNTGIVEKTTREKVSN